jgi:hypothetical protein
MAKGGSEVSATTKPQGKRPVYAAPRSDKDWLLSVQRKLYTRSMEVKTPGFATTSGEPDA